MELAFIGLGTMGSRMIRRLVGAGHRPTGYDVVLAARDTADGLGARTAGSIIEAVRGAPLVLSSLPMPADVEAVIDEALPALGAGTVWVDLSTIDAATARRLGARLAERDVAFLDAPVSGGAGGADAGTLSIIVGGEAAALERARPALAAFAGNIFHVGPVGAGSVVKLANQLLVGANTIAAMEAAVFAQRARIDPQTLLDVVSVSTGDSFMFRRSIRDFVLTRDFTQSFALRLLEKDLRLYAREAASLGAPTPSGAPTLALYEQAMASGLGGEDFAAILKLIEPSE